MRLDARPFASGASGHVFRGKYNGTVVAAKAIYSQSMSSEMGELSREVCIVCVCGVGGGDYADRH